MKKSVTSVVIKEHKVLWTTFVLVFLCISLLILYISEIRFMDYMYVINERNDCNKQYTHNVLTFPNNNL